MEQQHDFTIADHTIFKNKMLNWSKQFNIFCFLDNNNYNFNSPSFECILAAGAERSIQLSSGSAFAQLKQFYDTKPTWLFGHLGYELKNDVEQLPPEQPAIIDFGISFFFEPSVLLRLNDDCLNINADDPQAIFDEINAQPNYVNGSSIPAGVQPGISKDDYIQNVKNIIENIHRGDCYELNYCIQFLSEPVSLDPYYLYTRLADYSPSPFAAFYKLNEKYCICASPERYLKKTGSKIISQPMKGTRERSSNDAVDAANKQYLKNSLKEKSENVMVVDLVRNDLSKICREGTVYVDELFGVYSFPQVHQMISTVTGEMKSDIHWTEAIQATFPMGSMTGAPKKKVMELISKYERVARGLFSGSIGYVTPQSDFDFNVVIRSLFYDAVKNNLSFYAGSGITFYSKPEEEYKECMLKADAIREILTNG